MLTCDNRTVSLLKTSIVVFHLQAKASNETQKRANDSKSDGQQRAGADALGGVISKVQYCWTRRSPELCSEC